MSETKKSFLLYSDLIETVRLLPKDKQADLFMMILEYVNGRTVETSDLLLKVAFEPIKNSLNRDSKKYQEIKAKRAAAGSKGGKAKALKKANLANASKPEQTTANLAVNGSGSGSGSVSVSVSDRINKFKTEVFKFESNYKKEMLINFFEYWSERNPKGRKARWEKEKTFDLALRLKKWKANQDKWEKESPSKKKTASADWRALLAGGTKD